MTLIRTLSLCGLLAVAAPVGPAFAGPLVSPPTSQAARNPIAAPTTAGWTCQSGQCTYRKVQGAWNDCFTSWSPTHGGWLPTRYCR